MRQLGRAVLEDAQGGRLRTYGRRSAQVEVEGKDNDLIVIEDDFIVASVPKPIDFSRSTFAPSMEPWTQSPFNLKGGPDLT